VWERRWTVKLLQFLNTLPQYSHVSLRRLTLAVPVTGSPAGGEEEAGWRVSAAVSRFRLPGYTALPAVNRSGAATSAGHVDINGERWGKAVKPGGRNTAFLCCWNALWNTSETPSSLAVLSESSFTSRIRFKSSEPCCPLPFSTGALSSSWSVCVKLVSLDVDLAPGRDKSVGSDDLVRDASQSTLFSTSSQLSLSRFTDVLSDLTSSPSTVCAGGNWKCAGLDDISLCPSSFRTDVADIEACVSLQCSSRPAVSLNCLRQMWHQLRDGSVPSMLFGIAPAQQLASWRSRSAHESAGREGVAPSRPLTTDRSVGGGTSRACGAMIPGITAAAKETGSDSSDDETGGE